ncbi:hypothetical protein GCM10007382_27710 [Salinibacterium xinjiangense]|uniref:Cell division protein FtsL n=1 Tax=Salinibacterium xinjiangense TaxID=386302 RepID=A0A2C8ZU77_9MICO|nr:hypothetical protein [Salinibacterium xinjiangense]GGL06272.1 hypothetical protein GCM10007382_27710 [Salinibacterium xinjiangense]SOE69254.1 hypothetical protein SAMN06296378_1936 [Salinibacterium xinjiangense]
MSGTAAYARPLVAPAPSPHRHIEIVTTREQRRARPKLAYAVVTIMSLFAIFAAQLLLSIVVSDGAFQIEALQQEQKELLRTQDALSENLNLYGSTQNLATQAAHLGMVPNPAPLTLNMDTGAVYGSPGTADPMGCGGSCNLITNSLLAGMPLVNATGATTGNAVAPVVAPAAASQTGDAPPATNALPAPVTR